jgi:hypothetical protein
MNAHRDPDRLINAFLREGAELLDDRVYDDVRAEIEHKRQRAVIGPWRLPDMNKLVPIGLGAAAVIALLFLGSQFIRSPTSNVGGPASQPPASVAPSKAPASAPPSPIAAPPLTQSFTSTRNGISLSYPEGWTARAATEAWTESGYSVLFDPPTLYLDFLVDPVLGDHLFLTMASQPIGDATPEEWLALQMAGEEGCTATEPIEVGGATGLIGGEGCDHAAVTIGGRGYAFHLNASQDDPAAVAPYDRAWFEEVLATVQLHPEDAVDAAP